MHCFVKTLPYNALIIRYTKSSREKSKLDDKSIKLQCFDETRLMLVRYY